MKASLWDRAIGKMIAVVVTATGQQSLGEEDSEGISGTGGKVDAPSECQVRPEEGVNIRY